MIRFKHVAAVFVVAAAVFSSGCATIVKGSTQDLNINTDPVGANCDLSRAGVVIASVNPTPGSVQIKKDKNDIEVKCKKNGYAETSGRIPANFEGWTVGNVLFGGIIGIAVDYSSGALNSYEPELFVKLTPEKFASSEDKADFYEKWRTDVLQNSTKAKIAASKTCVKEQCDEISRRIDKETEQALAAIESNRNLRSSPAPSIPSPSQPQVQVAPTTVQIAPASAKTGSLKTGDKWIYQLSDNSKPVGKIVIEATGVSSDQVRERITRDGWPGFVAEREVATTFSVLRFQDPVKLPGGYQFAEISPYAPPDVDIRQGQSWNDIQGTVFIMFFGTQRFLAQAKVIKKETIKVPAGTFDAWRIEAVSENQWTARTVRMKFTYWYSPDMARTVKMIMDVNPQTQAPVLDSYELVSFEAGK
jgi:hypothetical protein